MLLVGDVTNLVGIDGPFDLVLDNGRLHSLFGSKARQGYVRTLLRLTRPGSRYFLCCFIRKQRIGFILGTIGPGEVERRFDAEFDIETVQALPPGLDSFKPLAYDAVYLMRRKGSQS